MKSSLIDSIKKNPLEVLNNLSNKDIGDIILEANYSYYNGKEPLFSDNIYDLIYSYLSEKDKQNPVLKKIGSSVRGTKVKLPYAMASLDKIKGDDNMFGRFVNKYKGEYIISDKLDGNSAMYQCKNGTRKLWSRGDGKMGQNLSHLIPFIKNLPPLHKKDEITVRGEVIISKQNFSKGGKNFSNARNMVAGLLNSKKPDAKLMELVEFICYELITPHVKPNIGIDMMIDNGFKVVWNQKINVDNFNSTYFSDILDLRRNKSIYEIDGIVIQHNEINPRVPDNPKYAFAFKSINTKKKAEVIVTDIEWNISKDKRVVPVVKFLPILIDGVKIKRATAHNAKFIKDNVIGPGSKIIIIRAGDVIPTIKEILSSSETGKPAMPIFDYVWGKSKVDIFITDNDSTELALKNLEYFFKKLEIEGLGPGNIKKLSDAGFKSPRSILNITKDQLLTVEGVKEKIAEKLYHTIRKKNSNLDCILLMSASNMIGSGIGVRKIKIVTDVIPQIVTHRYIPTMQELVTIKGIETTTAEIFMTGLPKFWNFIDKNAINCGLHSEPINKISSLLFKGEKIVFTGFRKKEWEKAISDGGGTITTSVSSKTTLVVCKGDEEKASGKAQKAQELGIIVLSKDEFCQKYHLC